jgi:hypothetical protein
MRMNVWHDCESKPTELNAYLNYTGPEPYNGPMRLAYVLE